MDNKGEKRTNKYQACWNSFCNRTWQHITILYNYTGSNLVRHELVLESVAIVKCTFTSSNTYFLIGVPRFIMYKPLASTCFH